MKTWILIFLLLFGIAVPTVHAESVNYTEFFNQWTSAIFPGQNVVVRINKVSPFTTDKHDEPQDSLAMFVTVTRSSGKEEKFLVLVAPTTGVYAYKKLDVVMAPKAPEEEGPSCSPEEHEQHHGKQMSNGNSTK